VEGHEEMLILGEPRVTWNATWNCAIPVTLNAFLPFVDHNQHHDAATDHAAIAHQSWNGSCSWTRSWTDFA